MSHGRDIESAAVDDLFGAPQHEVTRQLLAQVELLGRP
jgi:ABC-type dipeptide/oligopeptide/nickel transport system ATPase component